MNLPFWPDPQSHNHINLGLDRVFELLARLNNPHLKIPPTIHIAGTNGKGSTLAFLRAIFAEAGLKIHSYTSPHLVNFNERILLAGKEISDEFLGEILTECKAAAEKFPQISITFFEGITAAAFLAFSRVKADLLLLETGMGGRLDATNVLPEVLCSVITPIAFDHEEFLGKTLAKIAREKAGIIKKNCPVFVGKQKKSALRVIEERAQIMGSEAICRLSTVNCQPSLEGEYQKENASLAVTVALTQKQFHVTQKQIENGLKKTFWPARLQKISAGKFFKMLPKNCELYLDGSHNLQGAGTVREFLKSKKYSSSSLAHQRRGSRDSQDPRPFRPRMTKIIVIFSMLKDKNCEGFLRKIAPQIDQLIALEIPNESRSRSAANIKKIAKKIGIKSTTAENFEEAVGKISAKIKTGEDVLVLTCGSLYLAGEFLEKNYLTT